MWYHNPSPGAQLIEIGWNRRDAKKGIHKTYGQFISIYFSLVYRSSGPYFIPLGVIPYKPSYGTHHVWCLNVYLIYTANIFPLPKLVRKKCIVDPDIAQFKWKDLGEKTTLAVVVSEQCTSQGSLRNRRKIYHTPHFPYSTFSILLIFHTPHSSYSVEPVICV